MLELEDIIKKAIEEARPDFDFDDLIVLIGIRIEARFHLIDRQWITAKELDGLMPSPRRPKTLNTSVS
jgi:hypothetical protein